MAPYTIRVFGDPVLKQRANEITDIDGAIARLADDMLETLYDAHGAGLAATQVGVQKRLFVYDIDDDPIVIVNPVITETRGEWTHLEGCLSVPGLSWEIVRPKEVLLTGYDLDGNELQIEADELEARVFLHELDHLDGVLLLEHLDEDQRKEARKALREMALAVPETVAPHLGLGTALSPAVAPSQAHRLVFLGTPDAAVAPLRALHDDGFDIALVVTRADARRGRGSGLSPSPVKAAALELGLPVSHRVDDVLEVGADLGVVVAFGRIIKPHVLDVVPMVNIHFSLLPRWRGAAPVERALLAGDTRTGVCLMDVDEGLDTGGVRAETEFTIGSDETADELRGRLVEAGTSLLRHALRSRAVSGRSPDGRTHLRGQDRARGAAAGLEPAGGGAAPTGARGRRLHQLPRPTSQGVAQPTARPRRGSGPERSGGDRRVAPSRQPERVGGGHRRGPAGADRGAARGEGADGGGRLAPRPAATSWA